MKMLIDISFYTAVQLLFGVTAVNCAGKYNILFLAADDMRPEIGAYIDPQYPNSVYPEIYTPNLDALAARSLTLKQAHVQQALCGPSRTSLLTGRRPDTTHVYNIGDYFRNVSGDFVTLPQYFKQHGYDCRGIGKIFHPGPASGDDDPVSWSAPYFHGVKNFEDHANSWKAVPDDLLLDTPLRDEQLATHAVDTLKEVAENYRNGQQNFFLAVGFHKPHLPFVFPESILQYYPEEDMMSPHNPYAPIHMPEVAWWSYDGLRAFSDIQALNATGAVNTTLPDKVIRDLRRAYYSAVTWTDMLIGRVLQELERLGLSNNTIVSFFGDHGYQLGEHGEWGKMTNFELATRAPMMIHIPGLTDNGLATNQLTEFVDLFPTLVEATGLDQLPLCPENSVTETLCREGISLMPLIINADRRLRRGAFSQHPRPNNIMGYSIRTDSYRYTEWVNFSYAPVYKPDWTHLAGVELYDHLKDSDENNNRANDADYSDIRMRLSEMLHQGWRHSFLLATETVPVG